MIFTQLFLFTYLSRFSMNQCSVLLYRLITKKRQVLSIQNFLVKFLYVFLNPEGKLHGESIYIFHVIYYIYHKDNSGKFEGQLQWVLKFSIQIVGSTFNTFYRVGSTPLK